MVLVVQRITQAVVRVLSKVSAITKTEVDVTVRINREGVTAEEVQRIAAAAIRRLSQFTDAFIIGNVETTIVSVERNKE